MQLVPVAPVPAPARAPTFEANGKSLSLFRHRDTWVCRARDLGRLLDYVDDGKKLVSKIGGGWSVDFDEGVDFFKGVADSATPLKNAQPHELILTPAGINLVCLLTRKPLGREIRRWLSREVMIQIAETGSYSPTGTNLDTREILERLAALDAGNAQLLASNARLELLVEQLVQRSGKLPAPRVNAALALPQPRSEAETEELAMALLCEVARRSSAGLLEGHVHCNGTRIGFLPAHVESIVRSSSLPLRDVVKRWVARGAMLLAGDRVPRIDRGVKIPSVQKGVKTRSPFGFAPGQTVRLFVFQIAALRELVAVAESQVSAKH